MRYCIIGAGGMGGIIGGHLAAAGKSVSFFARGAHLNAMRENGLTIHTPQEGEIMIPEVAVFSSDDPLPKADVIFVCVKGYSLNEVVPIIERVSEQDTIVIPILNGLRASGALQKALAENTMVAEGCIYASAYVSAPGVITQNSPGVSLVFGAAKGDPGLDERLEAVAKDLRESKIEATVASDARAAVFQKFICISSFAIVDTMFDLAAGQLQKNEEARTMFRALVGELVSVAKAQKIKLRDDINAFTEQWVDSLGPDMTSSLHKDWRAGRPTEKQTLVFDVIELAGRYNVPVPTYEKASLFFGRDDVWPDQNK